MKTIELQCYGKSQRTGKTQLISQTFTFKEAKIMTKKEQLKVAFKIILEKHFIRIFDNLDKIADELLKEVSIRTPLR